MAQAKRSYPTSDVRGGAGMSYPTSEVRGSGQECQAATMQEQPREATPCQRSEAAAGRSYPHPRSGAAAGRSYPVSEVRGSGREELPPTQGQGQQPGGATPRPRSGVVAKRSNPTSKKRWLCGRRRAERSSVFKVRRGGGEDTPSSKVRSSSCALLEQPRRDTPRPR